MLISEIKINNFRNLSNVQIKSNEDVQYIFGDNGIGKSNILEMLNIIFNKGSFIDTDFFDSHIKIEILLKIKLSNMEIGYFDDLFEPEDPNNINIIVAQENPNARIEFRHMETETIISYAKIRNIPFVYYNSVQAPDELTFNKTRATGKFLNTIMENYIKENEINSEDIINEAKLNEIIEYLNNIINNISIIKNSDISTKIDNKSISLIPKLVELSNATNISVNNMGSGIRYTAYIFFEILNTIMNTLKYSKEVIQTDESNNRFLPIFIVLDEPEIHLHPFMQRNIINGIKKIITNQDEKFIELLKECFGIDFIIGQVIIATHSPYIISDNYKEYVRLYKQENQIIAKTGSELNFGKKVEKHLLQHFPEIKEAFFSKVVLLFEGISEQGIVPYFAQKIDVDLDSLNISVISADGEGSVRKIKELLENFGINVVAVIDRDVYTQADEINGILCTERRDLECDIVEYLINNMATKEIIRIIKNYEDSGLNRNIQKTKLERDRDTLEMTCIINSDYTIRQAIQSHNMDLIKLVLISWLWTTKGMIIGRIIGKEISKPNIPNIYKIAINKAKEISENV